MGCKYCDDYDGFNCIKQRINFLLQDRSVEWTEHVDEYHDLMRKLRTQYAYVCAPGWEDILYFTYDGGTYLDTDTDKWYKSNSALIRYCPVCGRKLED